METKIKSDYLSLLKQLIVFSLLLVSVAVVLFFLLPGTFITPALFFLFPFFISVTLISANILIRSARKKFIRYLNVYMLTTLVKLILYVLVMVVYILLNKQDVIPFFVTFLILYLLYTIFEVVWLVKFFKAPASE
jgi:hypothetical protein